MAKSAKYLNLFARTKAAFRFGFVAIFATALLAVLPQHAYGVISTGTSTKPTQTATSTNPKQPTSDEVVVYRLYQPKTGEHLYTTDANERKVLTSKHGWRAEGEAWKSGGDVSVKRVYNAKVRTIAVANILSTTKGITTTVCSSTSTPTLWCTRVGQPFSCIATTDQQQRQAVFPLPSQT